MRNVANVAELCDVVNDLLGKLYAMKCEVTEVEIDPCADMPWDGIEFADVVVTISDEGGTYRVLASTGDDNYVLTDANDNELRDGSIDDVLAYL